VLLAPGCGGAEKAQPAADAAPAPAAKASPKAPFTPVDACSLLTRPEVEALVGRPVMEPRKEQAANLVTCSYGDPAAPKVGDRPLSQVLTLSVFTGEEGAYHAGPVAQAKDSYEMARKNAASAEAVDGLGDGAHWDKTLRTLSVYRGRLWITAEVEADAGVEVAKKVIGKALERLP
jgi:hypothetical protein